MSYKPFMELPTGAIFRDVEHRDMLLMKTDSSTRAVLLESVWIDNTLLPRGKLLEYDRKECVVEAEYDDDNLSIPVMRKDPVDPRRRFWKEGDTEVVGRERSVRIPVFAGLFMYSGFGQGTYYAATLRETFWCNAREAREKAAAEGVLYVHYDSKDWTQDPTLSREKLEAQRRFDERKTAEQTAAQATLASRPAATD